MLPGQRREPLVVTALAGRDHRDDEGIKEDIVGSDVAGGGERCFGVFRGSARLCGPEPRPVGVAERAPVSGPQCQLDGSLRLVELRRCPFVVHQRQLRMQSRCRSRVPALVDGGQRPVPENGVAIVLGAGARRAMEVQRDVHQLRGAVGQVGRGLHVGVTGGFHASGRHARVTEGDPQSARRIVIDRGLGSNGRGAFEERDRFVERGLLRGRVCRTMRVVDGPSRIARRRGFAPLVGEGDDVVWLTRLELLGDAAVKLHAARRTETLEKRAAYKSVREAVLLLCLLDQARRHRSIDHVENHVLIATTRTDQDVDRKVAPDA